jgi:Flp pilus assembly protein TadD
MQAMNQRHSFNLKLSRMAPLVPAALLLLGAGPLLAEATCTPPQSMKAQLQGKPTAAAFKELGVWFADQQQYACAADAFASSLQTEPDQKDAPHVAFMFGVSLYFSGDVKGATAALQEAEQLGYRDIKLHIVLATIFDSAQTTKEAEVEWRAALTFAPESSAALDGLSNDLILDGDFNGVIAELENPRLLGQRTPQQSFNLAAAYAGTAKLDEAVNVLRDGLNTSPDSLPLANRLASLLVQINRPDEALTVLDLALAQHPDDPEVKQNMAKVMQMLGAVK